MQSKSDPKAFISDLLFLKKMHANLKVFSFHSDICKQEIECSQKYLQIISFAKNIVTNLLFLIHCINAVDEQYIYCANGKPRLVENKEISINIYTVIYSFCSENFQLENSICLVSCAISIFHQQKDVNEYQRQKIPALFC